MGGYGAAVINAATSIGAGLFGTLVAVFNGTALADEKTEKVD